MSCCLPCRDVPHRLGLLLHGRGRGGRHARVHLARLLLGQEAEAIPLLSSPGHGPCQAHPGLMDNHDGQGIFKCFLSGAEQTGSLRVAGRRRVVQSHLARLGRDRLSHPSPLRVCSTIIQARKTLLWQMVKFCMHQLLDRLMRGSSAHVLLCPQCGASESTHARTDVDHGTK